MFSLANLPSTSTLFSSYASLTGTVMLFRSLVSELVPHQLQNQLLSKIQYLFNPLGSQLTLVIEEFDGLTLNQVYEASELYLSTKISPSVERLRVVKLPREKSHAIKIDKGEEITDVYQGIQLKWKFISTETTKPDPDDRYAPQQKAQERSFELKFQKKHREQVVGSYLSHVLNCAKMMKEENKVVKLYTIEGDGWRSISLEHPATFDTLGIDQKLKSEILEDLERFVRRREFYKSVGKAWKRGYLLYGPPGTGKSSLVAAIANHLKFDVYDMDLAQVYGNYDLRRQLVATTNRSIIVLEDIDCAADFKTDATVMNPGRDDKITLSGLLNFIDGLWSSCGDERIIIFTTNHKDRLDPALLRPGRMDKHIHMSYCTRDGFNVLASNYLGIHDNKENRSELYLEIENMIDDVQVTPAEVAEELMKSEDAETALSGLLESLNRRKADLAEPEDNNADQELETTIPEAEDAKGITTRTGGILMRRFVRGRRGRRRRF